MKFHKRADAFLNAKVKSYHAEGMRGKAQGADCRDEKGDCGNQGKHKKRELTKTVSLKNCGAVGKENDFQIPSAQRETTVGLSRNFSMPTEHAAKIRIYTFLSDVAPEGQAKTPALFLSEQYPKNTAL